VGEVMTAVKVVKWLSHPRRPQWGKSFDFPRLLIDGHIIQDSDTLLFKWCAIVTYKANPDKGQVETHVTYASGTARTLRAAKTATDKVMREARAKVKWEGATT
jgi:hypothetical protein